MTLKDFNTEKQGIILAGILIFGKEAISKILFK